VLGIVFSLLKRIPTPAGIFFSFPAGNLFPGAPSRSADSHAPDARQHASDAKKLPISIEPEEAVSFKISLQGSAGVAGNPRRQIQETAVAATI
jgi:hypothetical protein